MIKLYRTNELQWIEEIIRAPKGIAQLRQLVLKLAMTGCLVDHQKEYPLVKEEIEEVIQKIPAKTRESIRFQRSSNKPIALTAAQPEHWYSSFLEGLAILQTGATPSRTKQTYFQGDIKWLVSGDVNTPSITDCRGRISQQALEDTNCKIIPKDSVLIALNGQGKTRGTVAVLKVDATCNQSLIGITPRDPKVLTHEFLYWYLKSNYINIRKVTGLDDRRGLNMNHVSAFQIQVPPLLEQNLIVYRVKELMSLCDDLENKINKKEELTNLARKSLVGAISAAITSEELQVIWRQIQNNWELFAGTPESINDLRALILTFATSGLLVKQDFSEQPAPFKNLSDGRNTPKNWIWCELAEIATYGGNGTVKPESIPGDSWLLDLEDVEKSTSKLLSRVLKGNRNTTSNKASFESGDVLYGKLRPYLDKVLVADMPGYCTTEIVPIRPKQGIDPGWLRICLKRPEFISKVTELSYGTKMPRLGTNDAKTSVHPVPPLDEQLRIIETVDRMLAICEELENKKYIAAELSEKFSVSVVSNP